MKKLYALLALCLVFSFLTACAAGSKSNPNARIGPAKLTEEEAAMLQLCALPDALFFDFTTGSRVIIMITANSNDGYWVSEFLQENKIIKMEDFYVRCS